jgi:hypothetical protein
MGENPSNAIFTTLPPSLRIGIRECVESSRKASVLGAGHETILELHTERNNMWRPILLTMVLLAFIDCGLARGAQVKIVNPKNLPVDEERVNLLYPMACQEVAESLRVRDAKMLEYPLTLVLGEQVERYTIDHTTGEGTIYLQQWDETSFASSAVMLAVHHVLTDQQFRMVVMKTLKRFRNTVPVTVAEARKR